MTIVSLFIHQQMLNSGVLVQIQLSIKPVAMVRGGKQKRRDRRRRRRLGEEWGVESIINMFNIDTSTAVSLPLLAVVEFSYRQFVRSRV